MIMSLQTITTVGYSVTDINFGMLSFHKSKRRWSSNRIHHSIWRNDAIYSYEFILHWYCLYASKPSHRAFLFLFSCRHGLVPSFLPIKQSSARLTVCGVLCSKCANSVVLSWSKAISAVTAFKRQSTKTAEFHFRWVVWSWMYVLCFCSILASHSVSFGSYVLNASYLHCIDETPSND